MGLLQLWQRHILLVLAMALAPLVIDSAAPLAMVAVAMAMAALSVQVTLVAHLAIAMSEL